jgi:hypothetical protein
MRVMKAMLGSDVLPVMDWWMSGLDYDEKGNGQAL